MKLSVHWYPESSNKEDEEIVWTLSSFLICHEWYFVGGTAVNIDSFPDCVLHNSLVGCRKFKSRTILYYLEKYTTCYGSPCQPCIFYQAEKVSLTSLICTGQHARNQRSQKLCQNSQRIFTKQKLMKSDMISSSLPVHNPSQIC